MDRDLNAARNILGRGLERARAETGPLLVRARSAEKKILAIPDFTNCMSHGKNTRTPLVAVLRSMMEEGVVARSPAPERTSIHNG